MTIKTIYSTKAGVDLVLIDLKKQFDSIALEPRMVIFFSTSNIDLKKLNTGMKKIFEGADIFGCTTAGEITSGCMLKNSVVAMVFDKETIEDVKIEVLENIKSGINVRDAFNNFEHHFNVHINYIDFTMYIGMVLVDGLSGMEESLMESIASNTNLQFIGASAGDDRKYKETSVFANGNVYTEAALLILIKPKTDFGFLKTMSFRNLGKKLAATKVNEKSREVLEFDNKPAVDAYCEALGIAPKDAASHFMTNPVAIYVDNEFYVRSPQQVIGKRIKFYCNIKEGAELYLFESTDIIEDTKKAIEKKLKMSGKISGIINFSCTLRSQELEAKNQTEAYGKLFSDYPTIGFNTYGEELIYHINQTSTMLIFK
jgi:hypothetical protein